MKDCIKKTLGRAKLNYEEMETLLCEVEGTINSRPMTYLSDDPSEALTPAHLAIGRRLLTPIRSISNHEGTGDIVMEDMNKRMRYLIISVNC